jgi:sulfoxide reductase catalytic subunit YedY
MLIRIRKGWELPESAATPESAFLDRRRLLKGLAGGAVLAASGLMGACDSEVNDAQAAAPEADPSAKLYPVMPNPRYRLDRPLTDEKVAATYNNFYEFGSHKYISQEAQKLKLRPWEVRIDGMVKQPKTIAIDDLLARMPLEERLYRHRCVEAWAMAVPWSGFAFASLVDFAEPLASARYVRMETFIDPKVASGQLQSWYPWPYVEGLTIAEATNELAFLATGVYGKPLPKQMGAPLRLAVPWKYGFKSVKSIVRFSFTDKRPVGFWEDIQGSEYGFWANVNPDVPHPRWSQKTEELIGTGGKRVPTQLYNGYGEQVAQLYTGLAAEKLFM